MIFLYFKSAFYVNFFVLILKKIKYLSLCSDYFFPCLFFIENLRQSNIFNRAAGDVLSSDLSLAERIIIMSIYEELQIIISVALLIVAILTYTNKK